MFCCILELESFKDLLNVSDIGKLKDTERVHLVYVLQSEFFAKASTEFLNISHAYAQASPLMSMFIKIDLSFFLILKATEIGIVNS